MTLNIHNVSGAPASSWHSNAYAKTASGSWQPITIYSTELGDFINFSANEAITVKVDFANSVQTATLSPKRRGISTSISASTVTFTVPAPSAGVNGQYVLQIDKSANVGVRNDTQDTDPTKRGTGWRPLFIFANRLESTDYTVPSIAAGTQSSQSVGGRQTLCLGAGHWYATSSTAVALGTSTSAGSTTYYSVNNGTNTDLYLAPGAVFHGVVRFGADTENSGTGVTTGKLYGRGIVDATFVPNPNGGRALRINKSSGVVVDGIIFNNVRHWAVVARKSRSCTLKNIKVFSARKYWSGGTNGETWYGTPDGIDLVGCTKVTVTEFCSRAYDDAITLKSAMADGTWSAPSDGNVYDKGVIFQGWAGNAMEIGFETTQKLSNCKFQNIDVVAKLTRTDPYDRDAISINAHATGEVTGITYNNIYVEECQERFIGLDASINGAKIRNIIFNNIVFNQGPTDLPIYIGNNGTTGTEALISFKGLKFNWGSTTVTNISQIDIEPNSGGGRSGITFAAKAAAAAIYQEPPVADVYVQGNGTQSGTGTGLVVKNSSDNNLDRKSFIRFDFGTETFTTCDSAHIQVYVDSTSAPVDISLYPVADDSWTESMTWAGQPSNDDPIFTQEVTSDEVGTFIDFDVTGYINDELAAGRRIYSFLLYDSTVADVLTQFSSREGSHPPQMIIDA